ncbi:DUF2865 domain-containing protein [Pseudorhodoplanes sp.]|uniref:DUF2865 domain-containing protein n=1 Tax=Pseudorhodoplanes sp. TaxID=1934341 RepID=UPI003D09FA9C
MRRRRLVAAAAVAALFVADVPSPASAQNLFEALFGGFRRAMTPRAPSFADPNQDARADHAGRVSSGYCVRLCDGRYFPVSGRGRMNAAEMCRAFCPAAPTQIFSGGGIGRAVAPNGQRYSDLPNAFVYREKMVPDCSCDGKSPTGLVRFDDAEDPTLRTGDIVATERGLMTYRSDGTRSEFAPVTGTGLSPALHQQLTATRVAPGSGADGLADGDAVPSGEAHQRAQAVR